MSGQNLPYHLRQNKAVDRQVFFDLLTRIHGYQPISGHRYVSFGGPFLEDSRAIHAIFGIKDIVSLEENGDVVKRQVLNRPVSCIDILHQGSGAYIASYNADKNAIFWLDYTSPKDLRVQIQELESLLPKLLEFDILKITVNANPSALGHPDQATLGHPETPDDLQQHRLAQLQERLGDYLPNDAKPSDMSARLFPGLLFRALGRAAKKAMASQPTLEFEILTSFAYADGQTMLSVTGIVIEKQRVEKFRKGIRLKQWGLGLPSGVAVPLTINLPDLSTRERLFIDALLPKRSAKTLVKRLHFQLGETAAEAAEMIESYAKFYRHFPFYGRIIP